VPQRDLVIFLTFSVILVTLVGCGLTLPWLISKLHIPAEDDEETGELSRALEAMVTSASAYLDGLVERGELDAEHASLLKLRSQRRLRTQDASEQLNTELDRERDVVTEERATLVALRAKGEIENTVLRRLLYKLDLIESALPHERAQSSPGNSDPPNSKT
jgi:NhaP-type Na+/H+ or K+/H+ antiporter